MGHNDYTYSVLNRKAPVLLQALFLWYTKRCASYIEAQYLARLSLEVLPVFGFHTSTSP